MLRNFLVAGAAISALVVAACNPPAPKTEGAATPAEQAATPDANPAATVPTPANEAAAPDFVMKAAASDMFEVSAGQMAEKKSTNPKVKAFAAMMVKDHTKSTADLKKAIADSGQAIAPPSGLPADLQSKLAALDNTEPASFDAAYLNGQVDAHQDALNLLQRYAEDGDVPEIKAFAAATAPVVQKHLDEARALRDAAR